jgi:hypothetical protein
MPRPPLKERETRRPLGAAWAARRLGATGLWKHPRLSGVALGANLTQLS